jgi:HEAT repeat protein
VIGNMGGVEALPALPYLRLALRTESDPATQALAAACISNIGPQGAGAVPELKLALERSSDPFVRANSALALANIARALAERDGEGNALYPRLAADLAPAVPALAKALRPLDSVFDNRAKANAAEDTRQLSAEALARIGYPTNEKGVPAMREAIKGDRNQTVRQKCIWGLFDCKELDKHGLDRVLEQVLDEKGKESTMVRYDAARALAFGMGDRAPNKAVDTLMAMMADRSLLVYQGTKAKIDGVGDEAKKGGTSTSADARDDARFMGAHALGFMGRRVTDRRDAVDALRAAS